MSCRGVLHPAYTLYRVLVSSCAVNNTARTFLSRGEQSRRILPNIRKPILIHYRCYLNSKAYRPTAPTPKIDELLVLDDAIRASHAHLVTNDHDKLPSHQPIGRIFQNLDRENYHLVQVQSRSISGYPVVKIVSKEDLRASFAGRLKRQKGATEKSTKELELGWTIGSNDLEHRMKKLVQFLEQGKKVDIMVAHKKKRGKKAKEWRMTNEEAETLIEKIRTTASSVPGTKEYAQMEGDLGGQIRLFFQPLKKDKRGERIDDGTSLAAEGEKGDGALEHHPSASERLVA